MNMRMSTKVGMGLPKSPSLGTQLPTQGTRLVRTHKASMFWIHFGHSSFRCGEDTVFHDSSNDINLYDVSTKVRMKYDDRMYVQIDQ